MTKEVLAIGEKNYQEIKNSSYWKIRYSLKIPKKFVKDKQNEGDKHG